MDSNEDNIDYTGLLKAEPADSDINSVMLLNTLTSSLCSEVMSQPFFEVMNGENSRFRAELSVVVNGIDIKLLGEGTSKTNAKRSASMAFLQ